MCVRAHIAQSTKSQNRNTLNETYEECDMINKILNREIYFHTQMHVILYEIQCKSKQPSALGLILSCFFIFISILFLLPLLLCPVFYGFFMCVRLQSARKKRRIMFNDSYSTSILCVLQNKKTNIANKLFSLFVFVSTRYTHIV